MAADLDIVSGFAFLSFSNIEDLEHHIEETEGPEAKSRSLSVNVGGMKRKIQPKSEEKSDSGRNTSKRIRIPSQKILESFATKDIPLNELVTPTSSLHPKQPSKLKHSPEGKESRSYFNINNDQLSESATKPYGCTNTNKRSVQDDISLECSETIDVCLFEDDELKPLNSANIERNQAKKHKKKKLSADISDTSCQTMFRIKKKKKKRHNVESTSKSPPSSTVVNNANVVEITQENSQSELTDPKIIVVTVDKPSVFAIEDDDIESAKEKYKQLQATKYFDAKLQRQKPSNKVEKIDYCARSGGVNLVERHHKRQSKTKDDDLDSTASNQQQSPLEIDVQDSCDTSVISDNSYSSNESNADTTNDQEGLLSNKNRIFAGSSSVFVGPEEPPDESDINIDDDMQDPIHSNINIVKALPRNYLFGHFSTYPDKSTEGTVDVSIQIYENDIQLYMNYASDFNGKIIKIITPDQEEIKNTNSCLPHSLSYSGVPKFLQPQQFVKAIRSATERNRRHTIVDLFNDLKCEIFGDVREYYFSKQAILSKALEVISTEDQQCYELSKEKAKLVTKNQLLRKSVNGLLFGESDDCTKKMDVDKVTEYLKTAGFEIEIPMPETNKKDGKAEEKHSQETSDTPKSNVTKKGRPPLHETGKLFKKITHPSRPKPLHTCESHATKTQQMPSGACELSETQSKQMPSTAVIDTNIKGFVAIVPNENTAEITPEKVDTVDPKHEPTADAPISKIVCNISKYRLDQTGEKAGMTLITNPTEPLKAIESKNVVHIKISNDVMKQVSTEKPKLSVTGQGNNTVNDNSKLVELSQPNSVSTNECLSFSTQTDFDTLPPCTDHNSNSVKPKHQAAVTSTTTTTTTASEANSESKKQLFLLADASVPVTTTTTEVPASTSTPVLLKASDSLKKLVTILRERAFAQCFSKSTSTDAEMLDMTDSQVSTSTAKSCSTAIQCSATASVTTKMQDANPSQVSTTTANSFSTAIKCATQPTFANIKPQIIQASPTSLPLNTSKAPILQSESSKGLVTMTTSAQVLKANANQATMMSTKHVTMTAHGHISVSPANIAMATPLNVTSVTPKHVAMTIAGHSTATNPGKVTMSTPIRATSLVPKPITMTTPVGQQQPSILNVMKQPLEQRFVKVLPQSSVNPVIKGPVNIVPNSSSSFRLVFKPTGKPISTPMEQVQGALQTQRLVRLPINTSLPSNMLQAPNIRFLLQKNNPVVQQAGNTQNTVPQNLHTVNTGKTPQLVYTKPLVKIQPLPHTMTRQTIAPVASSCHGDGITNIPAGTMSLQSSLAVTSGALNTNPSTTSSALSTNVYSKQAMLRNSTLLSASIINQGVFSAVSSSNSVTVSQQGNRPLTTFQVQQQSKPPTTMQKPTSTSTDSKTIFSGMEQMVAKIPPPPPTLSQQSVPLSSTYTKLLSSPLKATVQLQRLGHDGLVPATVNTMPVINSSSIQPSTTCSHNTSTSMQTTDINQAKPGYLMSEEINTSFPTNIPVSIASQTSIPCSSTCSSVTFQLTQPQQDKTCSVVESTIDNSHVVTADTLSVWNIDSSIPDITSELQGEQGTSLTTGLFDNTLTQDTNIPGNNRDKEKEEFTRNDERKPKDFDLLSASLENPEQCF